MYIKRSTGTAASPCYDSISVASCFSLKVYHGGLMKHHPIKQYVGGGVDYFDYVKPTDLNMTELRKIAELCGYVNDSVTFWHKCGKFGNILRLISTEVEARRIAKSIPKDKVVELYFEHLDSYFGMAEAESDNEFQAINTQNMQHAAGVTENFAEIPNSSSCDEFEDSENEILDSNPVLDKRGLGKQWFKDGKELVSSEVQTKLSNEEGDSDCVNSSDNLSLDSDSENENFDFPRHNPKTDEKNPVLALEYTFGNKKEFKYAVETHEIQDGRSIVWCKNDKIRMRAKCIHSTCEWEIMASRMHRDKGFQIKTYNSKHSCRNWHHRNKTINSSFIAKRYRDAINSNRDWKVSKFRDTVSRQLKAHVSLPQARRAKRKAIALIDGDTKDQFAMLWDYCNELERANPGSSIYVKLTDNEMPNKPPIFQRIYICFSACKEGFKAGCRKLVGVDGCWLKGPMYGTQLLTAVGLDSNNNIFPVAYAVVEKETRETWSWFLNYLAFDLEIDDHGGWTFMSDKQKGLIEAFHDVLPFVSHRFCVRHLYRNFRRAGFSGTSLRNALWTAATATTAKFFDDRMSEIFNLDSDAASWLEDKPPSEWSRSHFNPNAKCDILLNNMCECFNSMILEAREKPIITLLEKLRALLMARMQANRDKGEKWNLGDVCPRIKDILHKNESAAAAFIPQKSNQWNYEILGETMDDNWAVDLLNRDCSCRKWALTGYPCKHAISAIWAKDDEVINYVDDCYKVETYRRIYEHAILPINGSQLWPKSSKIPLLPPKIAKKRGRKQKLRIKDFGEVGASRTRMKRKQTSVDCSICHKPGHNKRTCKFNYVERESDVNDPVFGQSTTSAHPEKLPVRRGVEHGTSHS